MTLLVCARCGHAAWSHGNRSGFPKIGDKCYAIVDPESDRDCDCFGYGQEQTMPNDRPLPRKYLVARQEAERFLSRLAELEKAYQNAEYREYFYVNPSQERAAVKRASLDLTRALADMRKVGD